MIVEYTFIKWHFLSRLSIIDDDSFCYSCIYDDVNGKPKQTTTTFTREQFYSMVMDMMMKQREADR